MISVQFSSKSELSSGTFDHVKVCEKVYEKIKLGIFFNFFRRAAHRRQKSKKMIKIKLGIGFLAACCAPPPKNGPFAYEKLGNILIGVAIFFPCTEPRLVLI